MITFGGDLFSPSAMSTFLGGPFQMIAGFNYLRTLVPIVSVVGNHEFDNYTSMSTNLKKFNNEWLLANIFEYGTNDLIPGTYATWIYTLNGLRIGFIGLAFDYQTVAQIPPYSIDYVNYTTVAASLADKLRNENGVNMVIALTHLPIPDERSLLQSVPGIDLCLAGHDHVTYTEVINGHYLIEGDVDLQKLAIVTVDFEDGILSQVSQHYLPINEAIPRDPEMQEIIDYWVEQFDKEGSIIVGNTRVQLMANESITRCKEANTGNFVADVMANWTTVNLERAPPLPVFAAINSGALRWTTDVFAGTNLTKGKVLDLLPFGNSITVIRTTGAVLKEALENSVSTLPNAFGGFLQISGFRFNHDCKIISSGDGSCKSNPGSRVLNMTYYDDTPINEDDYFYLALPDFLSQGGNGYTMFENATIIIDPENSKTIFDTVIDDVTRKYYISPKIEGRIIEN
jgi:2',3'-cyclic-nucleotide 2'-phosphodiesterase (5'-nucleotidase family)